MSTIDFEIQQALKTIPRDLEKRYSRLSQTIKDVEQELFELNVWHETTVEVGNGYYLCWGERNKVWRLWSLTACSTKPLIEESLAERIVAARKLVELIQRIAEIGRV